MDTLQPNIQNDFLNDLRKRHKRVNVFFVNGIKLSGYVQSFDTYMVQLHSPTGPQMIFKHAISTVIEDRSTKDRPGNRVGGTRRLSGHAQR